MNSIEQTGGVEIPQTRSEQANSVTVSGTESAVVLYQSRSCDLSGLISAVIFSFSVGFPFFKERGLGERFLLTLCSLLG
jgi:hypothetical protein